MKCVVCGAGGFIGNHLVDRLKAEGHEVTGIDQKLPEFSISRADQFFQMDLRYADYLKFYLTGADEVYQLAADMGGAGFVFTGENDAEILRNSTLININVLEACRARNVKRVFFSSSACIYPEYQQNNPDDCMLKESMAYPAAPDSEYGWEKLLSERLYLAYARNYGMTVRIGR
ncbi:MAG TPA: NAD-dependent epimerase/dehydratase family protein, partial [Candidatus Acidoferrum sp.]|nr:NAD-dependent epimerase/dehydratase family protein [Candidatus Acidoferrum sp.]